MASRSFVALASIGVFALVGCAKKANPDATGLDCPEGAEICPVMIAIKKPGPMTYANGALSIEVLVSPVNHGPSQIQLVRNGDPWQTVTGPSFTYQWDTTRDPERLDPDTVPSAAVMLKDATGAAITTTSSLSADSTTLTVTLSNRAALAIPATITETIAATIKDRAGNALAPVDPWSWMAPLWVKLPSLLGTSPSLALNSAGEPAISFMTPDTANPTSGVGPVSVARYKAGSTWDRDLGTPTSAIAASTIGVDVMGAPVVAWAEQNHVRVSRLAGTTWQSIGDDAAAGLTSAPMGVSSMALDAAGNPTVGIWDYVSQMGPPSGYVARWSGSAWQLLTAANMPFGTSSGGPLVEIDSAGQPAVWANHTLQRFVGGNWLTINNAIPNALDYATLDLDAQDRPVLAFQTNSGGTTYLDVRVFTANAWQAFGPSVSNTPGGFNEVHLAVAADGNPTVVYQPLSVGSPDLHVARYSGQTWTTDLGTVNAVSGGTPARVQLALDPVGAPVVAWEEYDPATTTRSVYVWKSNL